VNKSIIVAGLAAGVLLGGCRQDRAPADQRTDTITPRTMEEARAGWPEGLSELIDNANAEYSAGNFEEASRLYREASRLAPDVTASWFGIYMAEHARGNIAAADSAMMRAQELAPGASLIHGGPGDPHGDLGDTLPPGHP
jgi:Flp pilus assembly protein TadD